jgi:hypothetical protein
MEAALRCGEDGDNQRTGIDSGTTSIAAFVGDKKKIQINDGTDPMFYARRAPSAINWGDTVSENIKPFGSASIHRFIRSATLVLFQLLAHTKLTFVLDCLSFGI